MGKLRKKRGTKYVGSQIWDSQMPEFFSPICAHSPTPLTTIGIPPFFLEMMPRAEEEKLQCYNATMLQCYNATMLQSTIYNIELE